MKVLILGIDGYLGWSTSLRMIKKDHLVYGIDNLSKRSQLRKNKVISAFKINDIKKKNYKFKKISEKYSYVF